MTATSADRAAVRAVLVKARERLSNPERWTTAGSFDAEWRLVTPPYAVRWGLCDALILDSNGWWNPQLHSAVFRAVDAVLAARGLDFEDGARLFKWASAPGRTHAEVLALLDAAIAAAGEEGR